VTIFPSPRTVSDQGDKGMTQCGDLQRDSSNPAKSRRIETLEGRLFAFPDGVSQYEFQTK
jgi:hypothetical protein